jgi:hypothetical protein
LTGTELASPMSPYTPFGANFTGGLYVAASNDPPPTVALHYQWPAGVSGASEPNGVNNLVIDRSGSDNSTPLTISFSLSGTATYGVDYSIPSLTLTIPAGESSFYSPITVIDDRIWEGNETVVVTLLPSPNYTISSTAGRGWMTIYDNEIANPPSGDLDIIDSNGVEVLEEMEENPGGWVSVNNDNDNYNFSGANPATSQTQIFDKDESSKVTRENDLVQIKVKNLDAYLRGNSANYRLSWTGSNIKLWTTADKASAATNGMALDPSQVYNFWVEGVGLSSSKAAEKIQLTYEKPLEQIQGLVDQVNFTVYEVKGVMNVPGYSKYAYRAEARGGAPSFEAGTGVVSVSQGPGGGEVRNADILWGAGAVEGKYRVYPTSTARNFYVDREVNVVKVEISPTKGLDNQVVHSDSGPRNDSLMIWSSVNKPTIDVSLVIKKIEGPVVSGAMRGLRFIEAGMIQNVKNSKLHSKFGANITRMNALEGRSFLDASNAELPWYDPKGVTMQDPPGIGPILGWGKYPNERISMPVPETLLSNVELRIRDTPKVQAADAAYLDASGNPAGFPPPPHASKLSRYEIMIDFKLYFAVHTREAVLGSEEVFTQRGKLDWYFNGTGNWNQATGIWTLDKSIEVVANREQHDYFREVINGERVPITTLPTANNPGVPASQIWSTIFG